MKKINCFKNIKIIAAILLIMIAFVSAYISTAFATEEIIPTSNITLSIDEETFEMDTLEDAFKKIATEDEASIILNKDIKISSKITIPKNAKVTIESENASIITRGLTTADTIYVGQLFSVETGAELYLKNIIIDGENNWTLDEEVYEDALLNGKKIENTATIVFPEEGAPTSNAWMFNNKGEITLEKVEIKNNYNTSGCGLVNGSAGSVLTVKDTLIKHNAIPKNGSLLTYVTGKDAKVFIEDGTVITDSFVSGNGGIIKTYGGAVSTMNGGEISHIKAVNTNGVVSMTYGTGSTFIMNGGLITDNSGVMGINNGRNAPIYVHSASQFIMNGGVIKNNRGQSCGGVDSTGSSTSKIELNAGMIESNYVSDAYLARSDVNLPNDYDLVIGEEMKIIGNMTVSGGITNNGTIEGLISLNLQSKPDEVPISGTGKINGDVIIYHSAEEPVEQEYDMVDGYVVYCGPTEVVLTTLYKENVDNNSRNYNMVAVEKTTVDVPEKVYPVKTGYTFLGWYEDEELTNPWNEDTDAFSATKKLYASWKINTYKVTWVVDGVQTVKDVVYGEEIVPIDNPSKGGHDFSGWDGYIEGMTMPAKNITITARWNAHPSGGVFSSVASNVKKKKYTKKKVTNEIVNEVVDDVENTITNEIVEEQTGIGNEKDYEITTIKKKEKKCCWICWLILLIIILIILYIKYKRDEERRNQKSNRISKWK